MKLSSKSLLSPGRTAKQISLSTSLSIRLKNNGSIKGGQSPLFPTGTKKRGSGFENTEPTSPKVTCIGQVRVKTKKKHAMKIRSMSKRRASSGNVSFRRIDHNYFQKSQNQLQEGLKQRNQKWVHLPLTICEALRVFAACISSSRGEREKTNVPLIDEGEKTENSYRKRNVMEDVDISEIDKIGAQMEDGRLSVCVAPKNALLLMRCRSDPVKMADLSNKPWKSLDSENVDDDDDKKNGVEEEEESVEAVLETEYENNVNYEEFDSYEADEEFKVSELVIMEVNKSTDMEESALEINHFQEEISAMQEQEEKTVKFMSDSSTETLVDAEIIEHKARLIEQEDEELHDKDEESLEMEAESLRALEETENSTMEKETDKLSEPEPSECDREEAELERESHQHENLVRESTSTPLPDSLMLMTQEPKQSIDVYCSTEFIRCLIVSENKVNKIDSGNKLKKTFSTGNRNSLLQPPRSSCSYPLATAGHRVPIANEPFELTRCKSEPKRNSARFAQPEACSWTNRKLEPHRGAAGIGF